mgnify:CR=1 FL=1
MIDVLSYYNDRLLRLKQTIDQYSQTPKLLIITDDSNDAGRSYIKSKLNACKSVGIFADTMKVQLDAIKDEYTLYHYMELYSDMLRSFDGIIVQHPFGDLKWGDFVNFVMAFVDENQDVDGLVPYSQHKPCTPLGILRLIEHLTQQGNQYTRFVIVGKGRMIGKPLLPLIQQKYPQATIDVVDSKTTPEQFSELLKTVDKNTCVICATPVHNIVTKDNINYEATYIDCGCNLVDGKLLGNVSRECYNEHAMITPVPNGVGKLTVLSLLENVVDSFVQKQGK